MAEYDDNVFINCPFDKQYKPIFNAIVFAIHDAGFVARCGLEVIDSGKNRLARIINIIKECKYGIHDISRTELSGTSKLPRFNMPFECGLFWGSLEYGEGKHKKKQILVLDNKPHRYQKSLSDISGQDIQVHYDEPQEVIDNVRTWLKAASKRNDIPGGEEIWKRYSLFKKELPKMLKKAHITRAEINKDKYYPDYVEFIVKWLQEREAEAAAE